MSNTRWSERSTSERGLIIALFTVSIAIVAVAQRDLHGRSDNQVRGSKAVWRLVCLNALGALAYFRWGRRRA
jgi:hypothetical protein